MMQCDLNPPPTSGALTEPMWIFRHTARPRPRNWLLVARTRPETQDCTLSYGTAPMMQDLGTFGGTERVAYGVNDSGYVVVGTAQLSADGSFRAFLYDVVIKHQIGTFGGVNSAAYGINAAGIL